MVGLGAPNEKELVLEAMEDVGLSSVDLLVVTGVPKLNGDEAAAAGAVEVVVDADVLLVDGTAVVVVAGFSNENPVDDVLVVDAGVVPRENGLLVEVEAVEVAADVVDLSVVLVPNPNEGVAGLSELLAPNPNVGVAFVGVVVAGDFPNAEAPVEVAGVELGVPKVNPPVEEADAGGRVLLVLAGVEEAGDPKVGAVEVV